MKEILPIRFITLSISISFICIQKSVKQEVSDEASKIIEGVIQDIFDK
jgi:hypothetical protein